MFWADRASWPQRTALSVESVESSGLWRRWGLLSRVWIWLRDVGSTGSTVTWLVVVEVVCVDGLCKDRLLWWRCESCLRWN